jgi:hypothetical protein
MSTPEASKIPLPESPAQKISQTPRIVITPSHRDSLPQPAYDYFDLETENQRGDPGSSKKPNHIDVPPYSPGPGMVNTYAKANLPSQSSPGHTPHYGHPRITPSYHYTSPYHTTMNMDSDGISEPEDWNVKLCVEPPGDVLTCCEGWFSPCTIYGKTQYRLNNMASNKDPLDLDGYQCCNGPCALFFFAMSCFGLQCKPFGEVFAFKYWLKF